MYLVLGLGNPGAEYDRTRHNVGFEAVDELARRFSIDVGRLRHRAKLGKGIIGGAPVLLAKPMTFMNLSGEAAKPLLQYHGMEPSDLIVLHDEADLDTGTIRIKRDGGTAGHKGLKSIVAHLGTRDFTRVRIGVGHPGEEGLSEYVLRRPGTDEADRLREGLDDAADAVESIVAEGIDEAMRRFNQRSPR